MNWSVRDLLLQLGRLLDVDLLLGLLDQAEHVPHPEDPAGHPVRVEALELLDLLPGRRRDLIGLPVTALTESAAPPRASPSSLVITTPSNSATSANYSATPTASCPVIASTTSRTSWGRTALRIRRELIHHLVVDVQAAGRVDDQHVAVLLTGLRERPLGDRDRVRIGASLIDLCAGLPADLDQLLDGRRAVDVARGQGDLAPSLPQAACQLRAGRRLARTLEAGHQDHRRAAGSEGDLSPAPAHQLGELLVDDLHHLLARVEAPEDVGTQAALLDRRGERLDDFEVDVRLEQRQADLAHRPIDVFLGQLAAGADIREGGLQSVRELIEHRLSLVVVGSRIDRGGRRSPVTTILQNG